MRADISNGRFELASAVRVNHAPALNGRTTIRSNH
jgi:hypothetical protein